MEKLEIFPIKIQKSLILLSFIISDREETGITSLFKLLDTDNIEIKLLIEGIADEGKRTVSIVLELEDYMKIAKGNKGFKLDKGIENISIVKDVVMIRILGAHFDIRPGIASLICGTLEDAKVQILANSTTITSCLLIIPESQLGIALEAIHSVLKLPG